MFWCVDVLCVLLFLLLGCNGVLMAGYSVLCCSAQL